MEADVLNWPFFEDRHRKIAAELDVFAREELSEFAEADHSDDAKLDADCREIVSRLGKAGFLEASCQAKAEDRFDVRRLCLSRETLARRGGLLDFAFAMQGLGTGPISLFGSDSQRQEYLVPVMAGEKLPAFALSEPDAGSDVGAMSTSFVQEGDNFRLNGTKTWISNGGIADFYVVFAREQGSSGAKGISAFILDADTPGFSVAERIQVIAPHPLAAITFKDCILPASARIGQPGQGFSIAMSTLDVFRPTVGAAALGLARRAMDETLARVHERSVFGKGLNSFQITQSKIGEMSVNLDAAALLVYRAAWTKDNVEGPATREAATAKYFATEFAQKVIDEAVQLYGGLGVVSGMPVEVLYREIRALRIYEGTSEIQKLVIAKDVFKRFAEGQKTK
ncbi:MAG: acyl-CoA dehydrogenase family protein [Rhodobacteraceae bacterium]|nr:acyl-CoA dehydrogenase family protein [Paracoccaceae bacterium]